MNAADRLRAALALAGPVSIQVGPCMSHLLRPGDQALIEACPWSRLKPGDLVALWRPGAPLLHRFLAVRRTRHGVRLLTKGDRAGGFDRISSPEELLGRISGIRRDGRILLRPRGIPAAERASVAASLAGGLLALARRRLGALSSRP